MGLEILLKACWRHRLRIVVGVIVGALIAGAASTLMSPKYESSTDVAVAAVFPSSEVAPSGDQASYSLQPDRYVATQIELLLSRATAARVADELHLTTDVVRGAVTVAQLGKSDVVRVTTSSGSPRMSADIARHLVDNYVATVGVGVQGQYKLALAAVDAQLASVATQTNDTRALLNKNAGKPALKGDPLQQRLLELQTQTSQLTVQRQGLLVQSRTATTSTRVVSDASANAKAVGIGATSLVAYGGVLGLAVVLCSVALTTTPGRSIDLEGTGDVDGVPILGVLNRRRRFSRLPGRARGTERAYVRNRRVAGELSRIVQLKGPVLVAVPGGARSARRVKKLIGPLVSDGAQMSVRGASPVHQGVALASASGAGVATAVAVRTDPSRDLVTVEPLVSLLQQQPPEQVMVLAVDVERLKPVEVDEVLASLRPFGADLLGIVGYR